MKDFHIQKGLDIPYFYDGKLDGIQKKNSSTVSVSGFDYPFKPRLRVEEGDSVKRGEPLFSTKDDPLISVTSPVSGKVKGIHRGDRRALVAVSIDVESTEPHRTKNPDFAISYTNKSKIKEFLADNGAWVYFRTRPFNNVPSLADEPTAIFINAMDTRPGSVGMMPLLNGRDDSIKKGLEVLGNLTKGNLYFCQSPKEDWSSIRNSSLTWKHGAVLENAVFHGKHPAGLTSTHIHFIRSASLQYKTWTIPVDLLADIGELFLTGVLPNKTRVSLSGPYWKNPCILETTLGTKVSTLTKDYLPENADISGSGDSVNSYRLVSGSILHGWSAVGDWDFLGRFHNQISILKDEKRREFLDWLLPGLKKHSITRTVQGRFFPRNIEWNTRMNGSPRALVPIGNYERVMPMDILPTQLMRALLIGDWEDAIELGALELEEEDMSLLTYVCPGKIDFGVLLKKVLKNAKKELL